MEYYVDSRTMKQIDSDTIEHIGIPSMVLMERAALSVVKHITNNEDKSKRIIAVCGIGNNGGDGICIVRILHELGFDASVYIVGNIEKCSIETRRQLDIACNCGVKVIVYVASIAIPST